jgi:hypothetical protein
MADDFAKDSSLNNLEAEPNSLANDLTDNEQGNLEPYEQASNNSKEQANQQEPTHETDLVNDTTNDVAEHTGLTLDESYAIAGSKDDFDKAIEFVQIHASEELQAELATGLNSDNADFQKQTIKVLMDNYRKSPNYYQRGARHNSIINDDSIHNSNVELVTQRELADGLRAEMKAGRWDGTDVNVTPTVNKLRRGFLELRKHRQRPTSSRRNII